MTLEYRSRIWVPVPGYEGIYEAGDMGEIRSLERLDSRGSRRPETLIKPYRDGHKGYQAVSLVKDGQSKRIKLHRLIALVWHGQPEQGMQVNHLNGIKTDNRPENLKWCSGSENVRHAYDCLGRKSSGGHRGKLGAAHHASIPVIATCIATGEEQSFVSVREAMHAIGLSAGSVSRCCSGKWKSSKGYRFRYAEQTNA